MKIYDGNRLAQAIQVQLYTQWETANQRLRRQTKMLAPT